MIAEATSSIMLRAIGLPASRVGYAYVRLNGDDYGLYANVEKIDKVMGEALVREHAAHLRGQLHRRRDPGRCRQVRRERRARPRTSPTSRRSSRPPRATRPAGRRG